MNYTQILKKGENFLKKNKIKNPYLDTELILSKVIKKKKRRNFIKCQPWNKKNRYKQI